MKKDLSRFIFGALLVLAGILFLLQEFHVLGSAFEYLWVILMAAGAGVFLWVYFTKPEQWWAIIPGLTLAGLTLVGLENLIPGIPAGNWTGAVFLGCIGLAFWLVYLRGPQHWWAIIPGGVLVTLAFVAGVDSFAGWTDVMFFLGMGITFLLVALLPNKTYNTSWAYIPAGILILLGLVVFAPIQSAMNYIWPVLLVAAGVFILVRGRK